MKLTKHGINMKKWEEQYIAAIFDCWKCPCCGAPNGNQTPAEVIEEYGVRAFKDKTNTNMYVNCYRCKSCAAEWESEPYKGKEHFRILPPKRYK